MKHDECNHLFGFILLLGLFYYEKEDRKPLIIVKSVLSLLFVVTALLQLHPVPDYYHYLFAGLIFCLIGDVCLALPQKKAFMAGLVAFLVGHILYILAFHLSPKSMTGFQHCFSSSFV
jgi:uncharacterized membrane protein YhhN